jgi:hypothetical protein
MADYNSKNQLKLPFGTDLTNIGTNLTNLGSRLTTLENKTTFRQSIIDHTLINNPNGNLFQIITSGQKYSTTIKTSVGENIYPKTTNTLLTVYFSDIPQTEGSTIKPLVRYYCSNEEYPTFQISVINSTQIGPQLVIKIYDSSGDVKSRCIVEQNNLKPVFDITSFLNYDRPGQEIVSAQFMVNEYGGTSELFYKDCVNILSNVFI